jgi:hypothetical protein
MVGMRALRSRGKFAISTDVLSPDWPQLGAGVCEETCDRCIRSESYRSSPRCGAKVSPRIDSERYANHRSGRVYGVSVRVDCRSFH